MGYLIQGSHLYRRVRFPPSRPTNYFENPINSTVCRSGRSKPFQHEIIQTHWNWSYITNEPVIACFILIVLLETARWEAKVNGAYDR